MPLLAYSLHKRRFKIEASSGWHLTSNTLVVTLLFPLPYPRFFVDRSNAGSWIGSCSFVWESLDAFLLFPSVGGRSCGVSSSIRCIPYNTLFMIFVLSSRFYTSR